MRTLKPIGIIAVWISNSDGPTTDSWSTPLCCLPPQYFGRNLSLKTRSYSSAVKVKNQKPKTSDTGGNIRTFFCHHPGLGYFIPHTAYSFTHSFSLLVEFHFVFPHSRIRRGDSLFIRFFLYCHKYSGGFLVCINLSWNYWSGSFHCNVGVIISSSVLLFIRFVDSNSSLTRIHIYIDFITVYRIVYTLHISPCWRHSSKLDLVLDILYTYLWDFYSLWKLTTWRSPAFRHEALFLTNLCFSVGFSTL